MNSSSIASASKDSVRDQITKYIAEVLELDTTNHISSSQRLLDSGADSLVLAELVGFIELHFGVKVALRQLFEELLTIEEIANFVSEKLAPRELAKNDKSPDLAALQREILEHISMQLELSPDAIDVRSPLLEAGADSLLLADLVGFIQERWGARVALRQLFEESRSVHDIAKYVEESIGCQRPPPRDDNESPAAPTIGKSPPIDLIAALTAHVEELLDMREHQLRTDQVLLEAGADSLILSEIVGFIEKTFSVRLPLRSLFEEARTVKDIAEKIQQIQHNGVRDGQHTELCAPSVDAFPVSQLESQQVPTTPEPSIEKRPASISSARCADTDNHISYAPKRLTERQSAVATRIVNRLHERTRQSEAEARRSRSVLCNNRRSLSHVHPLTEHISYPIRAHTSSGSHFSDIDGNDYVDTSMGFGVNLFGHAPDFIKDAISDQLSRGMQLGPESQMVGSLAEGLATLTGHERFLFCNSGTEAVMTAMRLARAATGRSTIVMFRNAYHGHFDGTLAGARTVEDPTAVPMCIGISEGMLSDVVVLPFDSERALNYIREHRDQLAGVLVEPVQNRRPDLHPGAFLRRLRALTREYELPLIFDEILIGFRIHQKGGEGWFGIEADLVTYAKVIGGGMPLGVVAGRKEIMDRVDGGASFGKPEGRSIVHSTYTAGTYCKHPLAIAASRAVVDQLLRAGPALQEDLNRRSDVFAQELNRRMVQIGAPIAVHNFGSFFRFAENGNLSFVYQPLEMDLFNASMIAKGIYIVEGGTAFLSTAHTDDDVERIIDAAESTALELVDSGFWDGARSKCSPAANSSPSPGAQCSSAQLRKLPEATPHRRVEDTALRPEDARASMHGPRMTLSVSFFGKNDDDEAWSYADLIDVSRAADRLGFEAIWLPERHFHGFGGLSSNPSVIAAALSRETSRIKIRAGSVVAPLHHPVRVAEEWAMVDQLSNGRVGIAFASGWHAHDFIFAPEAFSDRKKLTRTCVETVRRLWQGEAVRLEGGQNEQVDVRLHPRPVQTELPTWMAALGSPETFKIAGQLGCGVLTNLIVQSPDDLARNIALYRTALADAGHDTSKEHVVVLLHTYLGEDEEQAKSLATEPLKRYLRSSIDLASKTKRSAASFRPGESLSSDDEDYLLEQATQRYLEHHSLIGSEVSCQRLIDKLRSVGVDEIACFVDFGLPAQLVSDSLEKLAGLLSRPSSVAPTRVANLPVQRQMLQASLLEETPSYQLRLTLEIETPIDSKKLQQALSNIVNRHAALRTRFSEDGQTHLVFPPSNQCVPLVEIDMTRISEERKESDLRAWFEQDALTPLDLYGGEPFRFTLLRVSPSRSWLVLVVHHIVYDNISEQVLLRELERFYSAHPDDALKALPPSTDYVEAVNALNAEIQDKSTVTMSYWSKTLASWKPLRLPFDRQPQPPVRTAGGRIRRLISPELRSRIQRSSAKYNTTHFMFLLAAYGRWLLDTCDQDDVLVGISVDIRPAAVRDTLLINAANLVPIRVRRTEGQQDGKFCDELVSTRKQVLDAMDHAMAPTEALNEAFGKRSWSFPPLMQTCFNWDHLVGPSFGRSIGKVLGDPGFTTRFPLSLNVTEIDSDWWLEWDYASALFNHSTVEKFAERFEALLTSACDEFEPASQDEPAVQSVLAQIEKQCHAQPNEIALVSETGSLSYGELKLRSDAVANELTDAGIVKGDVVAIELPTCNDAIVTMIGIWKAGAAFAPLDPEAPASWNDDVQRRVSAKLVVGGPNGWRSPIHNSAMKGDNAGSSQPAAIGSADAAYVITTSGTTGQPKAILVEHGNLSAYVDAINQRIGWSSGNFLVLTPLHVDLGYTMVWPGLVLGGRLHLASAEAARDATMLGELVQRWRISHLKITPTHLAALLACDPDGHMVPSQTLIFGGEPLLGHHVRRVWDIRPDLRVFNHYGPAETTVGIVMHEIKQEASLLSSLPLGRPLAHCNIQLLTAQGTAAGPNELGEIVVTGGAVARGYVDQSGLSARFSEDSKTERAYHTGDMARMNSDGLIEFVGRKDDLAKIRGHRVDLGLIKGILLENEHLIDVAIAPTDEGQALEAIVVPKTDAKIEAHELAAYLAKRLPPSMCPSRYRLVTEIPRLASGKADLRNLQQPREKAWRTSANTSLGSGIGSVKSPDEEKMIGIYRDVLQLQELGGDQCFFAAGGHSLVALSLLGRIKEEWGVKVGIRMLFKNSTPSALASVVAQLKAAA